MWNDAFNGGDSGAQQLPPDWIKHLMDISRTGMGIQKQPTAAPKPVQQPIQQPALSEMRLFNALMAPNKIVNEDFDGEYDDEAGMAQSNLLTTARAVMGLLKTIKDRDNLPEWGQEKIAKAEMMLVSVWDYLQSQKQMGRDPKVSEARMSAAVKLQRAFQRQQEKSTASRKRGEEVMAQAKKDAEKKQQGVAEEFGPLPREKQQIRLGRHTVDIERVGLDKNYISFAWHDSQGREHYEEVAVGDLGSYDDLIKRIKQEISYQERQYTDQGVAEAHGPWGKKSPADLEKIKRALEKEKKQAPGQLRKSSSDTKKYSSGQSGEYFSKFTETDSAALAQTATRLTDPKDGATAKLRAAGDKRREEHLKGRNIAKKNEAMMPASKFAGSDKNKIGAQGQLKGTAPKEQPTHKLVGETDKKKGADGKACWKGYKYAGTKNGKDKCVPIGEAYEAEMTLAILKLFEGKK
jgi:hypothetical protein